MGLTSSPLGCEGEWVATQAGSQPAPDIQPSPGIQLRGLVKSFGSIKAVRGVDISIERGETVAILGPNGAGKSTTIDLLLGLAKPDKGQVSVFGRSPAQAVKAGLVGGMLQSGGVLRELSIRELLTMMGSLYPNPRPVDEVLKTTGLTELAGRRANKLSGGQAQRLRFAVALVADPELLVLDEPTVALDVEGRREFWKAMRATAAEGKTVIFATHYLEEADEYADRIILMARGKVVADGPATEIKAKVGLKTIRATLPGVDPAALQALPGVSTVELRGEAIVLRCTDSDATLHRLLRDYPSARDIEVLGAGLEEAFLELTGDHEELKEEEISP
jgi:ABC-2 type transport system ATP-binding protein